MTWCTPSQGEAILRAVYVWLSVCLVVSSRRGRSNLICGIRGWLYRQIRMRNRAYQNFLYA